MRFPTTYIPVVEHGQASHSTGFRSHLLPAIVRRSVTNRLAAPGREQSDIPLFYRLLYPVITPYLAVAIQHAAVD
jgi:hypothetical protein